MMVVMELSKIFRDETRRNMEEMGVPSSFKNILFELHHANGASQLDIAKRLRLKPPTVSLTIKKMEEEGYVYRKIGENDKRVFNVFLTEKGAEFHIKNHERIDNLDRVVMEGISDNDKDTVLKILIKMRNNLCEATGRACRPFTDDKTIRKD